MRDTIYARDPNPSTDTGISENNVPNLDTMARKDLGAFWARHQRGRNRKELFPAGGKGTVTATSALANYAINKATAMDCRLKGDIVAAQCYELACDLCYKRLPAWAQW